MNFKTQIKMQCPQHFSLTFTFDISAVSEPNFLKHTLITFKNYNYALVCMVIS